jgi:hypothetical protein
LVVLVFELRAAHLLGGVLLSYCVHVTCSLR